LIKEKKKMVFPDLNAGYVFGYRSKITREGILISFLSGIVKIRFKNGNIGHASRYKYNGGRISWNVIRWGKCPQGKEALKIILRRGIFRNNIVVFDNLEKSVSDLENLGVKIE
jgi:hypothetical protein